MKRSTATHLIRAIRSVINAEVRMRLDGTGDYGKVGRAHIRLENALRRVPNVVMPERDKELLL